MRAVVVSGLEILGVLAYSAGAWYIGRRFGTWGLAASWMVGEALAALYVWMGRSGPEAPSTIGWHELWPGLLLWTVGLVLATWVIQRSLRRSPQVLKARDLVAVVIAYALAVGIVLALLVLKYGYGNLSITGAG